MGIVLIDLALKSASGTVSKEINNVKSVLVDTENDVVSVLYGDDGECYIALSDVSSIYTEGVEITYA